MWVPWHLSQGTDRIRTGYGWVWAGPSNPQLEAALTTPDMPVIALRLLALTAIATAAFIVCQD